MRESLRNRVNFSIFLFIKFHYGKEQMFIMKAFKTFIASAIAGAMILSMATSAFAMTVDSVGTDSKVSVSGASDVGGERTVLVVNKSAWVNNKLASNPTIMYINQVDNGSLGATLAEIAGKDLIHGDYVVLVGSEEGTVDSQEFTAIKVVANAATDAYDEAGELIEGVKACSWEVTMNASFAESITNGDVKAKFYDTTNDVYLKGETTLEWDEGVSFSGSGVFTITAETTVSDQYVADTQLEISAGTVSNRN